MANATTYRTCPRSGLQFEASAELLIKTNAVVAVVFLLAVVLNLVLPKEIEKKA